MHNSTIKPKPPKQKVCLCPCGEKFTPKSIGQKWVNMEHRVKWLFHTEDGKAARLKQLEKDKKSKEKQEKSDWNKKKQELLPIVHEKKYKGLLQNEVNLKKLIK